MNDAIGIAFGAFIIAATCGLLGLAVIGNYLHWFEAPCQADDCDGEHHGGTR